MFGPIMFSAAHSEKLQAHAKSGPPERPAAQWKRGVRMDGSVNCLGYYLEVAPPATPVSSDDESEMQGEGKHDELGPDAGALELRATKAYSHGVYNEVAPLPGSPLALSPARPEGRMAARTHYWISLWFLLTIPVIFWDAGYCFLRPRSMRGGDLHWLWKPYALYQEVDYVYGLKAYEGGDGFPNAQSLLNIVENFMNIAYLYLAHVVGTPVAPLVGFASAVMTLSKTVLYWVQEYYCNGCSVGHNSLQVLVVYWIIPNGLWLVIPSFIIWQFGKDIVASLRVAEKVGAKEVSGKTQ